ncbi:MAG TPA: nicotinate-nucleotide adenylyltransferase [Chthoniobacterales bacterium]
MRKIGLYGGTFDPIHNAHLILAREALEQLQVERVIFIPAAASPHKLDHAAAPAAIRAEMLHAAIEGEPGFAVDELELRRPPPSFTIETAEEFRRRAPDAEIYYLLGSDNLPRLHTWHRFDDLAKLVRFVVLERGEAHSHPEFTTIRRLIDISATEIRNRVAAGRSVRYLVPPAVEEIIRRRAIYQEPQK